MTVAPLPVEQEQLIVVDIVDGLADTAVVHLPVAVIDRGGLRFDAFDFPPTTWPSACGLLRSGHIYVKAGEFTRSLVCRACEESA